MTDPAISFRLDDESRKALNQLEASGMTRSEAIRYSLLKAARQQHSFENLRAEVAALQADEVDQSEMQSVAGMMESIRAAG